MTQFFWSSGHLGWAFFLLLVYSGVCLLAGDLTWRLVRMRGRKLVGVIVGGWLAGVVLILLGTWQTGLL
ncbi:MAG TPA: hypothetical protein VF292_09620 [Rhodanobacteraceae bacterium]